LNFKRVEAKYFLGKKRDVTCSIDECANIFWLWKNTAAIRLWSQHFVNPQSFDISNEQLQSCRAINITIRYKKSVFSRAHGMQGQEQAEQTRKTKS